MLIQALIDDAQRHASSLVLTWFRAALKQVAGKNKCGCRVATHACDMERTIAMQLLAQLMSTVRI